MKKTLTTLSSLALLALASQASAAVVFNAGFEDPISNPAGPPHFGGWTAFSGNAAATAVSSTTNPRSGASSADLFINGVGDTFAGVFQDFAVVPGDEVSFEAWHASTAGSDIGYEYRIEWRNASDAELSRVQLTDAPGTDYEMFSVSGTAPVDSSYVRVVYAVQSFQGGTTGGLFMDDVVVTIPEPTGTSLLGLAFLGAALRRKRS